MVNSIKYINDYNNQGPVKFKTDNFKLLGRNFIILASDNETFLQETWKQISEYS